MEIFVFVSAYKWLITLVGALIGAGVSRRFGILKSVIMMTALVFTMLVLRQVFYTSLSYNGWFLAGMCIIVGNYLGVVFGIFVFTERNR